jgi:hypothetical protein
MVRSGLFCYLEEEWIQLRAEELADLEYARSYDELTEETQDELFQRASEDWATRTPFHIEELDESY